MKQTSDDKGGAAGTAAGRGSGVIRRWLPLLILASFMVLVFAMGWHKYLSFKTIGLNYEALRAFIADNIVLAVLAYVLLYIAVVALSLPGGALLTISGGLLFGWLAGGLVTVVAATIGASILFLIARSALGEPLAARAGPWLGKLRSGFQEDALNYLLFLRLVPAFPFWLVNLAPALLGVSLRLFVLGTFFGIIPGTFTFAIVGSGLDSIIDAQLAANPNCLSGGECAFRLDTGALVTREILIAFAALGIIALLPVIIKRVRARRRSST